MAANRGTAHQSRPWPPLRAAACGRYKGPPAPLQALWGDRLYRIGGSRLRLQSFGKKPRLVRARIWTDIVALLAAHAMISKFANPPSGEKRAQDRAARCRVKKLDYALARTVARSSGPVGPTLARNHSFVSTTPPALADGRCPAVTAVGSAPHARRPSGSASVLVDDAAEDVVAADGPIMAGL